MAHSEVMFVPHNDIKIYLVSDPTQFALTDVYDGYKHALNELRVSYETFPEHLFRQILQDGVCFQMVHSTALIKSRGFTHVMFIGGLNVPNFLYENLYHVKSVVIATEDPHSFDPNKHRLSHMDYYFSNERSIGTYEKYKNTYYCPTGASTHACGKFPVKMLEEKYHSDILFLGAIYPNRRQLLESIIPFVKKHGLNFKICGHVHYLPKRSSLWEYVFDERTIPHEETVKYYNGAKVVLNFMRDVKWSPRTRTQKNPLNRSRFKPESLNPRAYEVPLCQSFMLMEDCRDEAREIFTEDEVGFFSDPESLEDRLRHFLIGSGKDARENMAFNAFRKVAENHTYVHRLKEILAVIAPES